MFWRTLLSRQFRRPQGLLGHWAARFMEKNNGDYYRRVIELLEVTDTDSVLEVGFGTGLAIQSLLSQNTGCRITGIDFSKLMLEKAVRNNREALAQRRLRLILGDLSQHDFGTETFTKLFGINVVYFWTDLPGTLAALARLTAPGGRLVLYMSSPERLNTLPFAVDTVFNKYSLEQVQTELAHAGFSRVTHTTVMVKELPTHYLCAEKALVRGA